MSSVHKDDIRVSFSDWRGFSILICVCVCDQHCCGVKYKNCFPVHMHMEVAIIRRLRFYGDVPTLRVVVKNDSFVA